MKKIITIILVTVAISAIGWMAKKSFANIQKGKEKAEKLSMLPGLKLFDIDSAQLDIDPEAKSVVLIHFNSECDHCQLEIQAIKEKASLFNNAELVFFSTEPISAIRKLALSSGLTVYPNIHFSKISSEDMASSIGGNLATPHVFIYGKDRSLKKEFKGETKPEAIIKYLD